MGKEQKRKKALLIIKITAVISVLLLVALFSIIIAQTVKINRLQNEIDNQNIYYSEATISKR
jgi:hypothetical protein